MNFDLNRESTPYPAKGTKYDTENTRQHVENFREGGRVK